MTDALPDVELPIVYTDASAYFASFPCPLKGVLPLLPDRRLQPITLWPGMACLTAFVFNHRKTSIGPYGEVAIGIACRYGWTTPIPMAPLLLENSLDDVGYWVVTRPATTEAACRAGKAIWGYPNYVAEIDTRVSEGDMLCVVKEGGRAVMEIAITRPGATSQLCIPLRTYSRHEGRIHRTDLGIDGIGRVRKLSAQASLRFTDHPRNASLAELPQTYARPMEVRWFDQFRFMLDRARFTCPMVAREKAEGERPVPAVT